MGREENKNKRQPVMSYREGEGLWVFRKEDQSGGEGKPERKKPSDLAKKS